MPSNYEDNYGFYHTDDDTDELKFLLYIQATSLNKKCLRCRKKARLQPHKKLCAPCTMSIEYGEPTKAEWAEEFLIESK